MATRRKRGIMTDKRLKRNRKHIKFLWWLHRYLNKLSSIIWYYIQIEGSYRKFQRSEETILKIKEFILNDMCEPCNECQEYQCDECNYSIILDYIKEYENDRKDNN